MPTCADGLSLLNMTVAPSAGTNRRLTAFRYCCGDQSTLGCGIRPGIYRLSNTYTPPSAAINAMTNNTINALTAGDLVAHCPICCQPSKRMAGATTKIVSTRNTH